MDKQDFEPIKDDQENIVNQPSDPVTQNNINTQSGDHADGNIDKRSGTFNTISADDDLNIGGDVVGRDKITYVYQGISPPPTPLSPDEPPAPGEPPFKGLQYFDEADVGLFFGREGLTAKLVGHLRRQNRFLAIVGASGSGKSSVVRAGLVPALKRGEPLADGTRPPHGSARWPVHLLTPTAHPLKALAVSLTRDSESVSAATILMDDFAQDSRSLDIAVSRIVSRASADRLLLVVDQFEELFTLCRDEAKRQAFVDNLLTATAPETEGPTIVVITLRADFYAYCFQFDNLRAALEKWQALIGPMSADELRQAIQEPAQRNGWEFEPGLVEVLLHDVGGEPGALPLLSHALLETWKRRSGRRLTLKGYAESGGVRGAIAKTAETVYQQLTPEQRPIARRIFLQLTELGEGTQDTRRRATRTELIPRPEDKAAVEAVLKRLADERLIMTEAETADVAHEALIREWPTLRGWLDEDREGLKVRRRLTEAAQGWAERNRDQSELYRGARLAAAREWAALHADELNALEHAFLEAGRALEASELEAAKKRAAQLRNRALYLSAALVLALMATIAAMFFGGQASLSTNAARTAEARAVTEQANAEANEAKAQQQARVALAGQLSAQSQAALENYPQRSLLLAVEAMNVTQRADEPRVPAAEQALREALANTGGLGFSNNAVAISPDGHWLVTGSSDKTARLWDLTANDPAVDPLVLRGHEGSIYAVAISPDDHWLVTSSDDHTARLWDLTTDDPAADPIVFRGHESSIYAIGINRGGHWLVTSSNDDYTARLWDLTADDPAANPIVLGSHEDSISAITISPDGHWLVTGSDDGTVRLWDLTTDNPAADPIVLSGHAGSISAIAISPDGHWLVTGSWDTTARRWDLTADDPAANPLVAAPFVLNEGPVDDIAISPDGHWLVTLNGDGTGRGGDSTARLWNLTPDDPTGDPTPIVLSDHEGPISAITISPDGHWLVTGNTDGTAQRWDLTADNPAPDPIVLRGHEASIYAVAISSDGHWLITYSADHTARLWDLTADDPAADPILSGYTGYTDSITYVAISPDNHWLVTSSTDRLSLWGTVRLSDLTADDPAADPIVLTNNEDMIYAITISPDSHWLVTGSDDYTAQLWDLTAGDPAADPILLSGHEGRITDVAISPDSHWLVTGSTDGTARLWDLTADDPADDPLILHGHEGSIDAITISPDGHWLVTGSADRADSTAQRWDLTADDPAADPIVLSGHEDHITAVAISPDGHWLVTGSADSTARLWDLTADDPAAAPLILRGHESSIYAITISPDGHWLVTGSATARLWDLTANDPAAAAPIVLRSDEYSITDVTISPDGHWLVTGSDDGTARRWNLRLDELIDLACHTAGRNLTQAEWAQYLGDEPYHQTCEA